MNAGKTPVTRQEIAGIWVLPLERGLYVEVAERVRAVHLAGKRLSVEQAEVLQICSRWFYRTHILVGEQRYIGDAEIFFTGETNATNPISTAQTSAIGQALEFAGFGDLKTILLQLGRLEDGLLPTSDTTSTQTESRCTIAGVEAMLLDHTPYVSVAERLFHLHRRHTAFSMEHCEILECAGRWIYRVAVLVDGQHYLGDAELFFDAPAGTPDATHPITCGQISAVGAALALAGFGDVRSILDRQGKSEQHVETIPSLASADAVLRARQQNVPDEATPATSIVRRTPITTTQREQIVTLCQRLGVKEPIYELLSREQAEQRLLRLQREEAALLQEADEATNGEQASSPAGSSGNVVDPALVKQLAKRWGKRFQPVGNQQALIDQWSAFKMAVCNEPVSDAHMQPDQYTLLEAALSGNAATVPQHPQAQTKVGSPVRQAPQLTTSAHQRTSR